MFQVGKNECISQSFFQFLPLLHKDSLEFFGFTADFALFNLDSTSNSPGRSSAVLNMAAKAVCVLKSEKVNGVVNFVQDGVSGIFSL